MPLSCTATHMEQRLGHPATRAEAQRGKDATFPPALAACGGGRHTLSFMVRGSAVAHGELV